MPLYRRHRTRRHREAGAPAGSTALRRSERILRRRQLREAQLAGIAPRAASIATTSRGIRRPRGPPRIRRSQGNSRSRIQLGIVVASFPPSILARARLSRLHNIRRARVRSTRATPPEHVNPGAGTSAATVPQGASDHCKGAVRLSRELQDFMKDPPEGCTVELVDDNIFKWKATITGPKDTPYEGGTFVLSIGFDGKYPFEPPSVYFDTKVYHCNVAACGYICMDILTEQWSPILTVSKVLLSILSLLADPNPDDPLDPLIAAEFKWQRRQHDKTARTWTNLHARPDQRPRSPSPE